MVKIKFLGPITRSDLELDIKNLKDLSVILKQDESLKDWLEICAVSVNDEIVSDPNFSLKNGDIIAILPPVCGG